MSKSKKTPIRLFAESLSAEILEGLIDAVDNNKAFSLVNLLEKRLKEFSKDEEEIQAVAWPKSFEIVNKENEL